MGLPFRDPEMLTPESLLLASSISIVTNGQSETINIGASKVIAVIILKYGQSDFTRWGNKISGTYHLCTRHTLSLPVRTALNFGNSHCFFN